MGPSKVSGRSHSATACPTRLKSWREDLPFRCHCPASISAVHGVWQCDRSLHVNFEPAVEEPTDGEAEFHIWAAALEAARLVHVRLESKRLG